MGTFDLQPHLREILNAGDALLRDVGVAQRFGDYIEWLPRVGDSKGDILLCLI
jgi:hypothetical protein